MGDEIANVDLRASGLWCRGRRRSAAGLGRLRTRGSWSGSRGNWRRGSRWTSSRCCVGRCGSGGGGRNGNRCGSDSGGRRGGRNRRRHRRTRRATRLGGTHGRTPGCGLAWARRRHSLPAGLAGSHWRGLAGPGRWCARASGSAAAGRSSRQRKWRVAAGSSALERHGRAVGRTRTRRQTATGGGTGSSRRTARGRRQGAAGRGSAGWRPASHGTAAAAHRGRLVGARRYGQVGAGRHLDGRSCTGRQADGPRRRRQRGLLGLGFLLARHGRRGWGLELAVVAGRWWGRGLVVNERSRAARRGRRRRRAASKQILLELHHLHKRLGIGFDFLLAEARGAQHDLPFLWQTLEGPRL